MSDPIEFPGKVSDFHGFKQYTFTVDGCESHVVVPKEAREGNPWIWRAEFFGAFPQIDIGLLKEGFHLCFITVGNTFGCPDALAHWDVFYAELTEKFGLSRKPVLEGLSRGGLYIYNWARANTEKVACLFGDAPVCDFKSWPAGKGVGPGSVNDWSALLNHYHFANEAEALAYTGNPVDNMKPIVDAGIPLIHIYGDVDEVVPWEENTLVLKERVEALGGSITLIPKPGVAHHPHGLDDPSPVVDFILKTIEP